MVRKTCIALELLDCDVNPYHFTFEHIVLYCRHKISECYFSDIKCYINYKCHRRTLLSDGKYPDDPLVGVSKGTYRINIT